MPQKISDLSDLLSEDKYVRLRKGGPVYTLPGDIPAELFLRVQLEAERQQALIDSGQDPDNVGAAKDLRKQLLELFRYGDPDMIELPPEMTLGQMMNVIARVYGVEEPAGDDDEPRPSRGGTSSMSGPRRRPKSR